MEIGVNTFGIGKEFRKDFQGTLQRLSSAGITSIEPLVMFVGKEDGILDRAMARVMSKMDTTGGMWPLSAAREYFDIIRKAGFSICSVHMVGNGWKKKYIDDAISFAREQKIKYYVLSFKESSISKMAKEVEELRFAVKKFKDNGITLLMHNHEAEWMDCNGACVFTYLMDTMPELQVELDLGWTKFAGYDCVEVMQKYRARICILHFKDIREGADKRTRATCHTAVGEGSIPLANIMKEAPNMSLGEVGYIIDQDASLGDILEDIRISVENIKQGEHFTKK